MNSLFVNTAEAAVSATAFGTVINPIMTNLIDPLVGLAFAVALVVFVYGIIQMMIHDSDAEGHRMGRVSMISGLVGMFIMVSAWGIIQLISNTVKQF